MATPKNQHKGHNEGNIRQRTDGRWEVRLSAGIDYKTGKTKRTSTCCNTRQEAIAIMQEQAHDIRTNGWRDPMSVTLGQWYEYWLDTYMRDKVKQSTFMSYKSYGAKHFRVLYKILLKNLESRVLQEFYNYKFREEGLSPKTLRNFNMALHKCLQQAVKERLLVSNPCNAVSLPTGEKPEITVFTNDQQRALVQASYRHRYGVFIRLDLCTGLRLGELLALKWEDIDLTHGQLQVRRTINRLARYEENGNGRKTEIVFDTPKTKNSRRTIPLTRSAVDELRRWQSVQQSDRMAAGSSYNDEGFVVTNELGKYYEQKTFKDYYDRILKDAGLAGLRSVGPQPSASEDGERSNASPGGACNRPSGFAKQTAALKGRQAAGLRSAGPQPSASEDGERSNTSPGGACNRPSGFAKQTAALKGRQAGHFTFHALRHTFATRALERGMDYKTLSAVLGHYSVAFTMDTYVHSMDEHKRSEMDKMDDMFDTQFYDLSVEIRPYPVLCTMQENGCTAFAPDFPSLQIQAPTLDAALMAAKEKIQKALKQFKNPPIPTNQDQIVTPPNSILILLKAS